MERRGLGQIIQPGVFIWNQHRDRRTDGAIETHAGEKLDMIGFDFLSSAAAIAALSAAEFAVDKRLIDRDAGRQTFDQRDQRLPMRFPGGAVHQRSHRKGIIRNKLSVVSCWLLVVSCGAVFALPRVIAHSHFCVARAVSASIS